MKKVIIFISLITSIFILNKKVYAYQSYKVGDEVTYNDIDFYVIKDSNEDEDSVTLLKRKQLTVSEVNKYGNVGTDNNHVNEYNEFKKAYNQFAYGAMAYYTSSTCGYVNGNWVLNNCTTDYSKSDIKYVVDAWADAKIDKNDLVSDYTGYSKRLLTIEELRNNLGYGESNNKNDNVPFWVYESLRYWTMSSYSDYSVYFIYGYNNQGKISNTSVYGYEFSTGGYYWLNGVRPVVTLKKTSLNKVIDDINYDNYEHSELKEKYEIGDIVVFRNIKYRVIKDSSEDDNSILLLKEEPLSMDEVNKFGKNGSENNYVNNNVTNSILEQFYKDAYDNEGYGGMAYYSSDSCVRNVDRIGCLYDYTDSDIKHVVDAWVKSAVGIKNFKDARLITLDEYTSLCDYNQTSYVPKFDWLYNKNYSYWTGEISNEGSPGIIVIDKDGLSFKTNLTDYANVVRPVVELYKCAIDNSCDNNDGDIINDTVDNKNSDKKESITKVNTSNTLKKVSGLIILIGIVLVCAGLNIFIIIKNKDRKKD